MSTAPTPFRPVLATLLLVCGAQACEPPDRPPALPDPLPAEVTEWLRPDSTRAVRVTDGVWYRYVWSRVGPWGIHLVEADLHRCELGLEVVRAPSEPGKAGGHARVTELFTAAGSGPAAPDPVAAVNGDFFTPEGRPVGPEVVEGEARSIRARPALAWQPGGEPWIGTIPVPVGGGVSGDVAGLAGPGTSSEIIGGFPELLDRGRRVAARLVTQNPGFAASRHPRTAVGYSPRDARFWMVVVDGRQPPYSLGMTLPELTRLLEGLGAEEALNLDGGGSSVLVVRGRPVSRPSDEAGERSVVNALLLARNPGYCHR